jgi:hypothetical protein
MNSALRVLGILVCYCCAFINPCVAQVDTTKNKILKTEISKGVIKSITRDIDTTKANVKSEQAFMKYSGKTIRKITIKKIGFERTMTDTVHRFKNSMTKIANALHTDTREGIIRDHIFIRENKPLNPYLIADNERYLRDLDFILDSRIVVKPVRGNPDMVDLVVLTRDVFSLGLHASASAANAGEIGIYDANLFGMGQRVQTDFAIEADREPVTGFDVIYRKSSIAGSLINGTLGYTQIDNATSIGEENEFAYYLRLDRPLVSPYSRMAGGIELSRNWSQNVYNAPDSLFRTYRYSIQDAWAGYNFGINNLTKNRNRYFAALRYLRQNYSVQPAQPEEQLRPRYNDQKFLLGEISFYRQNFYKTRYVYGFGRTEDIPYGLNISATTGWAKQFGLKRWYAGATIVQGHVRKGGDFYEAEAGYGTFFDGGKKQDVFIFGNVQYYSKLFSVDGMRARQLIRLGYAKAINNNVRELLTLNDELQGFKPDSLYGYQRLSLRGEMTLFTNWKLIGFRFAPFLSLENALLTLSSQDRGFGEFYWGTTGGIRIRNENLIFGTIEFRAFYFPAPPEGVDPVSFRISTNVRLKYSGSFVKPPSFIRYN